MKPINLRRRRNLLTSPLFRLPTELILKIFELAIEIEPEKKMPVAFTLTAVCHQLREIGIASPQLWDTVDLTYPSLAELLLERCKYDPRVLVMSRGRGSLIRREAVWEQLGGRTFNNLRSIVFEGPPHELTHKVTGVLQRAPNISNLDLHNTQTHHDMESILPRGPMPNLSALRLSGFAIGWTSPLLRNLCHLTLVLDLHLPTEGTSFEGFFIFALANCPGLEVLGLTYNRPGVFTSDDEDDGDDEDDDEDDGDVVVQLHNLRTLSLEFRDPSGVAYTLSRIVYPGSTVVDVHVETRQGCHLSETISQVLSHRNVETLQHLRKSATLTIHLIGQPYLSADNFHIHIRSARCASRFGWTQPQVVSDFASKIVEVVGGDAVTSLDIQTLFPYLLDGLWRTFLRGLPQLERIRYGWGGGVEPFLSVFSEPFEGGLLCPNLQHLELPRGVLTDGPSVALLRRALTERDACGRRLKRLGLSDDEMSKLSCDETEVDDRLVLESFRDLVDEVE